MRGEEVYISSDNHSCSGFRNTKRGKIQRGKAILKKKKEKGKKETMNKYHTLQLDTSVVEKNKEATRFGKAATHSTLWDPVPGQNLQQQGDSKSQKGRRGGKGGYVGDHKLPGDSWGHSREK